MDLSNVTARGLAVNICFYHLFSPIDKKLRNMVTMYVRQFYTV